MNIDLESYNSMGEDIARLQQERDDARSLVNRLRLEAQGHAMEARGANDTIQKIYQIVTGARGEPGNWNAEVPVRERIDQLTAALKAARDDLVTARDEIFMPHTFAETLSKIDAALLPYVKRDMEAGR